MRKHVWVLLAFLGLSLLLTWPLAVHFGSHVPGDGIDDPSLAWNLWWAKHALVDQPQNPFDCRWIFWPVGINLAFYTLTLLNGVLSIPLQAVFGVIPAYNVLLISSFVLGGHGAYLLSRAFLASIFDWRNPALRGSAHRGPTAPTPPVAWRRADPAVPAMDASSPVPDRRGAVKSPDPNDDQLRHLDLAAFLGGALYAFASARLFYASLGQGNVASAQWAPFAVIYLLRLARPAGRPRDAALAALFLVLQAYAEQTYASFLLIFAAFVFIWGAARLLGRRKPVAGAAPHTASTGSLRALRAFSRELRASRSSFRFVPPALLHAVGLVSRSKRPAPLASFLLRFALAGVLFVAGIAPFLANMLPDLRTEGDFFTSGGGFADVFSADLAGYLLPTRLHPLLGGVTRAFAAHAGFPIDKGQQIYLGYSVLALAIIGLWRWRKAAGGGEEAPAAARTGRDRLGIGDGPGFWAVAALLFFLLTLGPTLRVAGRDTGFPLPFALVQQLPFFKGNRYPSRYSVLLLLCIAPLVALGAARVLAAIARWGGFWASARSGANTRQWGTPLTAGAFAVLLGLLLFEHLSVPLPLFDLRVPALYQQVAQEPGDFALLEMPPGWRNGARVLGKQDIIIMQEMWSQTVHGKRLLGGNTSRNPEFKFQYFAEDPTLARLLAQTNADDLAQHTALRAALAASPITAADRERAASWAAFLHLRYVMVHRDKLSPAAEQTLRDLLPVHLVAEQGSLVLYAVAAPAPPATFALNTPAGSMALAEGWSPSGAATNTPGQEAEPAVLAERQEVRLLLPLPTGAARLALEGHPAMTSGQQVTLVVDGRVIATQAWPLAEPLTRTFAVPADPARPLLSDVRLRFTQMAGHGPAHLAPPAPTGALPVVLARSAGLETGDFAHLYVDGVDVSPNRRGYNLIALSRGLTPLDLQRMGGQYVSFDTDGDKTASARLAAWVAALPPGTIVAGAVRDEASMNLRPEAVQAIAELGVTGDLRGKFRWGQAFIGV
ncbi:MAG TPA: interleukin-like EMT inducer domain-containing protein, partial [Anaerolineae bacterium]